MDELQEELAVATWRALTQPMTGAEAVLASFEAEWALGIISGDLPNWKFERKLCAALRQVEWSWPWFAEWYASFNAAGEFPFMWRGINDKGELEIVAARLLVHTASHLYYRNRRLVAHTMATLNGQVVRTGQPAGWLPEGWFWTLADAGDPIEMRIAEPYRAAIEAGDLTHIPPFFPGDRTSLGADSHRFPRQPRQT